MEVDWLLESDYGAVWGLKTFYDSNVILLFEPGWRSGYRAGLEIQVSIKWAKLKRQVSQWVFDSQGFESSPRRHFTLNG